MGKKTSKTKYANYKSGGVRVNNKKRRIKNAEVRQLKQTEGKIRRLTRRLKTFGIVVEGKLTVKVLRKMLHPFLVKKGK